MGYGRDKNRSFKAFKIVIFKIIVAIVNVFAILTILNSEDYAFRGLMELVLLDTFIVGSMYFINRKKEKLYFIFSIVSLLIFHVFLGFNSAEWNEGSMASSFYILPFLSDMSDGFLALIILSAFLLLIPLVMYIGYLFILIMSFLAQKPKEQV